MADNTIGQIPRDLKLHVTSHIRKSGFWIPQNNAQKPFPEMRLCKETLEEQGSEQKIDTIYLILDYVYRTYKECSVFR